MARKPRAEQPKSWDVYLARHTPAKWIGTVEAVNANGAIEKAAKEFNVQDIRKLIAVQRRQTARRAG